MSDDVRDLFGFAAPSQEQLSSISKWASKALELKAEIDEVEAHLKELNRELAQIEEVDLPRAMMSAGSEEFTMVGGGTISIDDVIQGSLAKGEEKREYAIQWVAENEGKEIIKRHFEIDYTRGQHTYAMALRKLLEDHQIHFDEFESIHTSTFKAFLREKLRKNIIPPFDKMGFRYFKKAIIKQK
jgi:trehalose-6-phosphate synthase